MPTQSVTTERLLAEALNDPAQRGPLLEHCENYLRLLARTQLDRRVSARVAASDVVQDTLLEAHRDFGQFRGKTPPELLAWLRKVLLHNLARISDRHLGAAKRDVRRERSLQNADANPDRSAQLLAEILVAHDPSPSARAIRDEELMALADALPELPPDYYEVLVARHLDGLPFREVAERMGRTEGAVRMVWFRAMDRLRKVLAEKGVL